MNMGGGEHSRGASELLNQRPEGPRRVTPRTPPGDSPLKAVFLSDTHLRQNFDVPEGDLLVHCGDALLRGDHREKHQFESWFVGLPHRHKVFVPGNHDWWYYHHQDYSPEGYEILIDREVEVEGRRIWGSPWQPEFCGWAFNLPRGKALREHWDKVPEGLDLLVTHSPPQGIFDLVGMEYVGDRDLLEAVIRTKPRVHAFGHIHLYGGSSMHKYDTTFLNCANVDESYAFANQPQVYHL